MLGAMLDRFPFLKQRHFARIEKAVCARSGSRLVSGN
jgi:hypothetical protein